MKRFAWMALGAVLMIATQIVVLNANNNLFNFVVRQRAEAIFKKLCDIQETLDQQIG